MKIKHLMVVSCLMTTTASAAVIVKGIEALSSQDQEKVFGILIKKKHDAENVNQINADLTAALPGKILEPYWVPDTLYQVIQTYFDLEGLNDHGGYTVKQAHESPDLWKEGKKMGDNFKKTALKLSKFRYYKYPTNLEEHKALSPTIAQHWARFNRVADRELERANFQAQGSEHALSRIFQIFTMGLAYNEGRSLSKDYRVRAKEYSERVSHLRNNGAFLKHALKVEEQAHREGKLLFWRYTQPLPGDIPDLPFKIQENNLEKTIRSPLEYFVTTAYGRSNPRFSYAGRLLDGYFGDGAISGRPYFRLAAPACTFSFVANDVEAKKNGHKIPNPLVYSLALSPEKIEALNKKLYLYHPREAMPQHTEIYGTGEGFHPGWLLDYSNKENVQTWLELMQSEALQVHLIKGTLQDDFKNNPELRRIRNIYTQFLKKTKIGSIVLPKEKPRVPPKMPAPIPPVKKAPVPVKKAPVPVKKAPVPVKKAPVPVRKAPVPVKQAPIPLKKAPVLVKKAPVLVKKAPVPVKKAPVPVKKAPVVVKKAPVLVKKAPVLVKRAPTPSVKKASMPHGKKVRVARGKKLRAARAGHKRRR